MIPVIEQAEPSDFDATVRLPGLLAIDELVGRPSRLKRQGPKRKPVATREQDIPSKNFPPFWRESLDDMMNLYEQRCAYLGLHLEWSTGNPSVDHYIPKSADWTKVYEWSNYRLCASLVNAKKGEKNVVDPFTVRDGWFALNVHNFYVEVGAKAPGHQRTLIEATLPLLNLPDCRRDRSEYIRLYCLGHGNGGIDIAFLERRAPFIAQELRRQGALVRGDS